jgi:hypothetical protein
MPSRRRWTAWSVPLVAEGVALLCGLVLLGQVRQIEQANSASDRFDHWTDLSPWVLTQSHLPAGWRSPSSHTDQDVRGWWDVRTAWRVQFEARDGSISGVEKLAVFPTAHRAHQWMDRRRHGPGVADPRCAAAVGDESFTVVKAHHGQWIVERDIRRRYVVVRLILAAATRTPEQLACSAELRTLVHRVDQHLDALLKAAGRRPARVTTGRIASLSESPARTSRGQGARSVLRAGDGATCPFARDRRVADADPDRQCLPACGHPPPHQGDRDAESAGGLRRGNAFLLDVGQRVAQATGVETAAASG